MRNWRQYIGIIIPLLVVAGLLLYPVITGKAAARETAFTILKAIALASSLNILLGYTGYVSFGHIVFFGFGGYVGFYLLSVQGMSLGAPTITQVIPEKAPRQSQLRLKKEKPLGTLFRQQLVRKT